jgi:hypothetical protein
VVIDKIPLDSITSRSADTEATGANGSDGRVRPRGAPESFLEVSGILHDAEAPKAIINGRIVGVGEVVDGAKVLAIDRLAGVTVEYKGRQVVLQFK